MALFSCSQAKRDYLREFGYGTLALPKSNVLPLQMLAKRGDRLGPIGPLIGTLAPGIVPLPPINRARTASVSGAKSKALSAELALDVLGAAIGALSGSSLGLKAAYKNASQVEFEFGDVFEQRADFNALDSYLAHAAPIAAIGPALQKLLEEDAVYVITATIETSSIKVKASSSSGADVGLSVPVVQQLVGGNVTVGTAGSGSSVLSYASNDTPLAIGAEVVRLVFDRGKYKAAKLVKPGAVALGFAPAEPKPADRAPDLLIEL